jgi:hypothetical protein
VASLVLITSTGALAQSAVEKETARTLMDRGDAAFDKQQFAEALEAYQSADAIMHVPTTGIAVAKAHAELGHLVEARDAALAVKRLAVAERESSRFAEARAMANELAEALAKRIPSLTIKVEGAKPESVKLHIDGAPVSSFFVKLNPGRHEITADAPGFATAKSNVQLGDGASVSVTLTLVPGAKDESGAPSTPTIANRPAGEKRTSPLVYIGFGVGAAGIAVGSVTGLMSLSRASSAKERCDGNQCPPDAADDIDASKSLGTVSNVSFAVGVVGLGVGVYGLFSSKRERTPARTRVTPIVAHRFVGLEGVF